MSDEPSGGGATPTDPQAQPEPQSPEKDQNTKTVRDRSTGIKLPGVVTRDDAADIFEDAHKAGRSRQDAEDAAEKEMADEKKNVPGLKFPEEKKEVPDPPPGAEEKPETPESAKQFSFAGKNYKDIAEAEQSFRSLQGMFKPLTQERDSERERANTAVDSAHKWREYALSLEQKLGSSPQPEQKGTEATNKLDPQKLLAGINGEIFEKLAQDPNRGLPTAGRYLAAQVLDAVNTHLVPQIREEIRQELRGEIDPLKQQVVPLSEQRAFEQATSDVAEMFEVGRSLTLPDGSKAFPELDNAETMMAVAQEWANADLPAAQAMTPRGLQMAIALYRMRHGHPNAQAAASPPAMEHETRPPAAVASQSGRGLSGDVSANRASPESEFARALDEASMVNPILGFATRGRR